MNPEMFLAQGHDRSILATKYLFEDSRIVYPGRFPQFITRVPKHGYISFNAEYTQLAVVFAYVDPLFKCCFDNPATFQVDTEAFDALIECVAEGDFDTCEQVPAGDDDGFLVNPLGGIAVDMAGASGYVSVQQRGVRLIRLSR